MSNSNSSLNRTRSKVKPRHLLAGVLGYVAYFILLYYLILPIMALATNEDVVSQGWVGRFEVASFLSFMGLIRLIQEWILPDRSRQDENRKAINTNITTCVLSIIMIAVVNLSLFDQIHILELIFSSVLGGIIVGLGIHNLLFSWITPLMDSMFEKITSGDATRKVKNVISRMTTRHLIAGTLGFGIYFIFLYFLALPFVAELVGVKDVSSSWIGSPGVALLIAFTGFTQLMHHWLAPANTVDQINKKSVRPWVITTTLTIVMMFVTGGGTGLSFERLFIISLPTGFILGLMIHALLFSWTVHLVAFMLSSIVKE
ncbi:MAG: hypothetical protein ACPGO5_03380 [Patescibacteria group bacterium]